jgi:hypothetical protein
VAILFVTTMKIVIRVQETVECVRLLLQYVAMGIWKEVNPVTMEIRITMMVVIQHARMKHDVVTAPYNGQPKSIWITVRLSTNSAMMGMSLTVTGVTPLVKQK